MERQLKLRILSISSSNGVHYLLTWQQAPTKTNKITLSQNAHHIVEFSITQSFKTEKRKEKWSSKKELEK